MSPAEERTQTGGDSRLSQSAAHVKQNHRAYLSIAPAALFLVVVVGCPVLETFRLSLYRSPADSTIEAFIGSQHYVDILNSDIFHRLPWQTGRWVAAGVAGKTLLGLLIAVHLEDGIRDRKFFRTAFLIPWGIPYAISAVVSRWVERPQFDYLNAILLRLGVVEQGIEILGSPDIAWLGVVVADIRIGAPLMAIIFPMGLQSIPQDLCEAVAIDEAERWHQFRYITLLQLKSVILMATLLSTIQTLISFDTIWTMTGSGPISTTTALVIHIYQVGLQNRHLGLGAACNVIGFLLLLLFAIVYLRVYTHKGEEL